ncbi:MAG: gluconeogenesis factor YvcK family protein [Microgenomates group bacterium]
MKRKKIVVIGGGTGTYTVLSGLKKHPVDLSAIVSMTDSGGSNKVIRDEFGFLPTSDIRQCMVALASDDSHKLLRELFTYRYNQGTGITGMTFGNLFMAALTDIYNSQEDAIKRTCEMLDVQGNIIPVTYDNVHLIARYDNGKQVLGEHYIDEPSEELGGHKIVELEIVPKAQTNKKALRVIKEADLVVLGPGDLYTSIICNLIVGGMVRAIRKSKAKVIFVMNLMTRFGQTNSFKSSDHLRELEKYLGKGVLDVCLINKTKSYPRGILKRYREEKAEPVKDDLQKNNNLRIIRRSFVSQKVYSKPKSDKLKRSLIRHDSKKLAKVIVSLL